MKKQKRGEWLQIALEYDKSGHLGICPNCGYPDIQVEKQIHNFRYSLTFSCPACNSFAHFDCSAKEKAPGIIEVN